MLLRWPSEVTRCRSGSTQKKTESTRPTRETNVEILEAFLLHLGSATFPPRASLQQQQQQLNRRAPQEVGGGSILKGAQAGGRAQGQYLINV